MILIKDLPQLKKQLLSYTDVAFVPTMGNLHQGHLDLVREARRHSETVVVSIFVNPLQFSQGEDLANYPRSLEEDCAVLEAEGVAVVYAPLVGEVYKKPLEQQTKVIVPNIAELYCGAARPGHFEGVATIVCKLFNQIQPVVAVFGKKDFQQLMIIRRMVEDLSLPIKVVGVETRREKNGLAMSSRNRYLSTEEREMAAQIYQSLHSLAQQVIAGDNNFTQLVNAAKSNLNALGFVTDYIEILDAESLLPTDNARSWVILIAAQLGPARLIDNLEFTR